MQGEAGHPDPRKFEEHVRCATTSTSNGVINLDHQYLDEEWLSYEKLTEFAFLNAQVKPRIISRDDRPPQSSTKKKRRVKSANRRRKCVKDIDERADGDKARNRASQQMRKSLFPHVPPYVVFQSHQRSCAKELPKDFSKLLRWKFTNSMPRILIKILMNSGYQMVLKGDDWSGIWNPSLNDKSKYRRAKPFQKLNTVPGSQNLGNKDLLWIHFTKMQKKFGNKEYYFMPKTYVLPQEMQKLENAWQRYVSVNTWIIKPPCAGRGQGIRVTNQWWEVPKWHSVIVQRYITRPKLINGTKFDLRVYVLLTSVNPFRIYIYKEGLVRFASVRYIPGASHLNDKYMHLTNTSVNKQNPAYVMNDGVNAFRAHKWSFGDLWLYLTQEGVDVAELWSKIKDIVVKTLFVAEPNLNAAILENLESRYTCYELYGFDILLDEDTQPWLLEVNVLPSLQTDSPLDVVIKGALVRNVLNMAAYQIPKAEQFPSGNVHSKKYDSFAHDYRLYSTALSLLEKTKQNEMNAAKKREDYVDKILEKLTRDDMRQLIRYEDELTQIGEFEKIFPTKESHTYFKYFEIEKYYDRLLDAWESRYSDNRNEGIARLQECCEKMQHLDQNSD